MRRSRGLSALLGCALLSAAMPRPVAADCMPLRSSANAPTALVLSGGGAKGAWEAGVATALAGGGLGRGLAPLPIRLATGSSAGALTAAMLADGRLDRLAAVWRSLSRQQVYRLRPAALFAGLLPGWLTAAVLGSTTSLLDPAPLRDLVGASLDLERVRGSSMRVLVVASDLVRRDRRVFDNRTLTVEALMAATALPGVFPPVEVDGDLLVDGGLIARAPVLEALEAGVPLARVIVVLSYAADDRGRRPTSLRRALEEAFETAMVHQIRRDVELGRLKYPAVDVQVITPSVPLRLRPLDFEPEALAAAFEHGQADGTACLAAWEPRNRPE
jgi:NTE family protein